MPTPNAYKTFVEKLDLLEEVSRGIPASVPMARKNHLIAVTFENIPVPDNTPLHWEVFNRRMDALFGDDVRDPKTGRLLNIARGPFGMVLVISYLRQTVEAGSIPWDLGLIKVERLISEIQKIWYVN